jgi:hypothetical protein
MSAVDIVFTYFIYWVNILVNVFDTEVYTCMWDSHRIAASININTANSATSNSLVCYYSEIEICNLCVHLCVHVRSCIYDLYIAIFHYHSVFL